MNNNENGLSDIIDKFVPNPNIPTELQGKLTPKQEDFFLFLMDCGNNGASLQQLAHAIWPEQLSPGYTDISSITSASNLYIPDSIERNASQIASRINAVAPDKYKIIIFDRPNKRFAVACKCKTIWQSIPAQFQNYYRKTWKNQRYLRSSSLGISTHAIRYGTNPGRPPGKNSNTHSKRTKTTSMLK